RDVVPTVVRSAVDALAELDAPTGPADRPAGADGTSQATSVQGRVAVLAAPRRLAGLREALASSPVGGYLRPRGGDSVLDAPLSVLDPRQAKGLEFDVVVLVDPAEVMAEGSPGDLYVAMTRPTRALVVVTSQALPDGFEPAHSSQAT